MEICMSHSTQKLIDFLSNSPTAYHAQAQAREMLLNNGFIPLLETDDWNVSEGGKYFIQRSSGSLIAFKVGGLDNFSYKIVASHTDSPMLKIKENPVIGSGVYATLNTETYGGGIWYSFFDRPLKIAGRVVTSENGKVSIKLVEAPFLVSIPSVAIHQNRGVNEGFSVNAQVDLLPLLCLGEKPTQEEFLKKVTGEENVISYDLFLVNADMPYSFGLNDEFLSSPRIDNLTSVCSSLEALISSAESDGVCVAAILDNEEIGSATAQGAGGNFLESVLRRIAYALRFDDNEFYKALANSFLLSADNAHALHPNHPEKCDPTNKAVLGGGVVIKSHANGAYATDGVSSAVTKTVLKKAGVKYQSFFNRSDVRSGSTLGVIAAKALGVSCADIALAQLAMHSSCECFAQSDYAELVNGLTAFYSSDIVADENGFIIR
jgi:aspartyl aminopeptidase